MGEVTYSESSQTDIFDIWFQVAARSPNLADTCLDKIGSRCAQLADFPELGPLRSDLGQRARVLVVDRWIILYRVVDSGVVVVRIVDSARDLSNLTIPND